LKQGTARHFFVQKVSLQVPSHLSSEPLLLTVAVYDRDMQQRLTADLCFAFPGSLRSNSLPEHLKLAVEQRVKRAVMSVASASRESFVVCRMHRLFRDAAAHNSKGGEEVKRK
jgi:hypothetical protein